MQLSTLSAQPSSWPSSSLVGYWVFLISHGCHLHNSFVLRLCRLLFFSYVCIDQRALLYYPTTFLLPFVWAEITTAGKLDVNLPPFLTWFSELIGQAPGALPWPCWKNSHVNYWAISEMSVPAPSNNIASLYNPPIERIMYTRNVCTGASSARRYELSTLLLECGSVFFFTEVLLACFTFSHPQNDVRLWNQNPLGIYLRKRW